VAHSFTVRQHSHGEWYWLLVIVLMALVNTERQEAASLQLQIITWPQDWLLDCNKFHLPNMPSQGFCYIIVNK